MGGGGVGVGPHLTPPPYRKCTFDMFNFLASQHRRLPEAGAEDEEEDEVQLKSTRYQMPEFPPAPGFSAGQRLEGWEPRCLGSPALQGLGV